VAQRIADAVATTSKGTRHVHSACDRDSNGALSAADLVARMPRFGCSLSLPEAEAIIKQFDRTGNGRLSISEFVAMMASASA
jgi:Ca2+-binding EF-hand superfamily protein